MRPLFFLFLFPLRLAQGELAPEDFREKLASLKIQDKQAESALNELYESRSFFDNPAICNGRLTTESGQPISTSDRTSQGTLYFTPYEGQSIALWGIARWKLYRLTERSLALSLANNRNYDIFIYNNSGTLTLERSAEWTDDFTRADALMRVDGVLVKASDATRRYIGSIRASGANVTEDSQARRFVWNYYNRVYRTLRNSSAASHSYASSTRRYFNNSNVNRVQLLIGETQGFSAAMSMQTGASVNIGLGIYQLTPLTSGTENFGLANSSETASIFSAYSFGYWFVTVVESATAGSTTFSSYSLYGALRN